MDVARLHGGRVSQTPSLRSGEMMGASPVLARKAKQVKGRLVVFWRGDEARAVAEDQHQVPPSQPWVAFVVPGCGGDRLGLKAGDLLLQVDGWEVATVVESEAAINNREPGSRIELTVERAGQRLTLSGPYETVLTDSQIISRIRRLADRGDVEAQFALAISLATGQFAVKDDSEAVAWVRKAADQGLADAQYNLGNMYWNGCGVAKDDAQAVYWDRKAADQGDADAQFDLGWMYANGRGVAKDNA
ncbi:MAG: PDZ domain-containing protein, partial [Isosphaeraceae bacterium]